MVQTPAGTESWKPVPHMEVIEAVTDVEKAHNWQIRNENFGLAREGAKLAKHLAFFERGGVVWFAVGKP